MIILYILMTLLNPFFAVVNGGHAIDAFRQRAYGRGIFATIGALAGVLGGVAAALLVIQGLS